MTTRPTPIQDKSFPIPTPEKLVEKMLKIPAKQGREALAYQVHDGEGIAYASDGTRAYLDTQPPAHLHHMDQLPDGLSYPHIQTALKGLGKPLATITITPYHLRRALHAAQFFSKENDNIIYLSANESLNVTGTSEELGSTTTTLTNGDKWETSKGNKPVTYTHKGKDHTCYLNGAFVIDALDYVSQKDETPLTIQFMPRSVTLKGATRSAVLMNMIPGQ